MNLLSHFSHNLERILIPFVLCVYAIKEPWAAVFGIVAAVLLMRYDKVLFACLITLLIMHGLMRFNVATFPEETRHVGTVTSVRNGEYTNSAVMRTNHGPIMASGFEDPPFEGSRYWFEGPLEQPSPPLFDGGFDYDGYLKSKNIRGVVQIEGYGPLASNVTMHAFRSEVKTMFEQRHGESAHLMHTFILADSSSLDESFKDKAAELGVSHLFAVSGMHVAFMTAMLYFLLKRTIGLRLAEWCVGFFLLGYIVLTGGPPSVLRSASMVVLLLLSKRFKLPLSAVDCVSMLCIAILIIRPYSLNDVGFVLSFLVSFTLLMNKEALQGKPKRMQAINVSFMAFMVTAPIVFTLQGQVNLMSVLYNCVLVWFLLVFILPLVYLTALLPWISPVLLMVYGLFEGLILLLHEYGTVMIRGHIPTGLWRIIYYGLFAWMMAAQGNRLRVCFRFVLLVGFIGIVLLSGKLNPMTQLTMFPVMGDAFLVQDRFDRCNVLVDTGEASSANSLVSALGRKQIRRLDYVFISHMHADHYGGYDKVAEKLSIIETVTPMNVGAYEGTQFTCGGLTLFIYPLEAGHAYENDRSLVLYLNTGTKALLFTGDIEAPREATFIDAYAPLPPIDILKAAHHGSNTSSTDRFLEAVQPKAALISAHPNNRFNHPGESALARFEAHNIEVHRTDESGGVYFYEFLGRWVKKTALRK